MEGSWSHRCGGRARDERDSRFLLLRVAEQLVDVALALDDLRDEQQ